METVLYVVLGLIVLVVVAIKAFFAKQGDAKLVIYEKKRTPLVVVDMDDKQVVLKSEIKFENRGTQASVITDRDTVDGAAGFPLTSNQNLL